MQGNSRVELLALWWMGGKTLLSMSTGEEDRIARSVALEKTYVHDVYDHISALQYPEHRNSMPWPKVKKFLNDLEPGSIVCDVGCGNGKYLNVNPSIFKIGSDRCSKLTQIAKDDDNEVLLCDNLTLPFRDESFDAVLSIAVIHHFATKERRVGALRELARILRIGGRLMITVWAMEQKDRKFESQDVLVQWHHPQFYYSPSLEFSTTATTTSEEDFIPPCRISQTRVSDNTDSLCSSSSSFRQDGRPGRSHLRLFQSLRAIKTSPSSSSLSSPNETCYSFVKKALQKLSRSSKKEKHRSRGWFLESWASFGKEDHLPATRYDPEGCEEDSSVHDLPIELRRMEKEGDNYLPEKKIPEYRNQLEVNLLHKSKSLNDILFQSQLHSSLATTSSLITRSRSNIITVDGYKIKIRTADPVTEEAEMFKHKLLVKQEKSNCGENVDVDIGVNADEQRDKATDMKKLVKELPMFKVSLEEHEKYNVLKQKSLNDDIMSADRIKEKEKVKENIQKQASLNEDLIYRRQRVHDSLRDTFLVNSSKRFQMFRSGLTNKLKNSTTNIEKVTSASIKSGFAKILQGLTGGEVPPPDISNPPPPAHHGLRKSSSEDRGDEYAVVRRCSHEENSDSSKDNSLLSDASIDSEDSIISVIERVITKATDLSTSPTPLTSPGPYSPHLALGGVLSHPSSPKISQMIQYPNAKAKALSLPASPRTLVLSPSIKQTFKIPPVAHIGTGVNGDGKVSTLLLRGDSNGGIDSPVTAFKPILPEDEPLLKLTPMKQVTAARLKSLGDKELVLLSEKLTKLSYTKEINEPRTDDICEGNDGSHKVDTETLVLCKERMNKMDYATKTKIGTIAKSTFAVFKKPSVLYSPIQLPQPRLPPYELFNPETEDIDTDSSGVSTPDSVGSVISVKMDSSNGTPMTDMPQSEICGEELIALQSDEPKQQLSSIRSLPCLSTAQSQSADVEEVEVFKSNKRHSSTSSKSDTSGTAATLREFLKSNDSSDKGEDTFIHKKYPSLSKSPENETWDKECRRYIVDLAENLSERLLAEIDRYKERNDSFEGESCSYFDADYQVDSYLCKLSEELSHVSKLSKELSQDLDCGAVVEVNKLDSVAEIANVRGKSATLSQTGKDEKLTRFTRSTEAESRGSLRGWLDSRRNTIESGYWKDHQNGTATTRSNEDIRRSSTTTITCESTRKLSTSETSSHSRLSIELTETVDVSERTVGSSEDNFSKGDTTRPETSIGLDSDFGDVDKAEDISSKSASISGVCTRKDTDGIKCCVSQALLLRPGESVESSDAGDMSDRTGSVSDFSRQNTESRSVITQSSASLTSWSDCSKDIRFADRRTARCDGRSSSEETNPRAILTRQQAAIQEPFEVKMASTDTSLSGSTSQDSLTSECAGGSIMFHRYYHVFREGELDELIDEFVENLHIISSYYDHTNWCIIAEKVRVWTI